jgi:hypothetical protein
MKPYRSEFKHCSLPVGSRHCVACGRHQRTSSHAYSSIVKLMVRGSETKSKNFLSEDSSSYSCEYEDGRAVW